jgi:hypothetical protein
MPRHYEDVYSSDSSDSDHDDSDISESEYGDDEDRDLAISSLRNNVDGKPLSYKQLHDAYTAHFGTNLAIATDDLERTKPLLKRVTALVMRSNYQGPSELLYNRFLRRLAELNYLLADDAASGQSVRRVNRLLTGLHLFFWPTNDNRTMDRETLHAMFDKIIEIADSEETNTMVFHLMELHKQLERNYSSVDDPELIELYERFVDDISKFEQLLTEHSRTAIVQSRVKAMNAYMKHTTTKADLRSLYYDRAVSSRIIETDLITQVRNETRGIAPYDDRDAMRFKRFFKRAGPYERDLIRGESWASTSTLLWIMHCYFHTMRGPVLDRETLHAKFRELAELVIYASPLDDDDTLDEIVECVCELQDYIESVESLADDVGISPEDFERFVEELGLLRDSLTDLTLDDWNVLSLRVDSLMDLVRLDDAPIVKALIGPATTGYTPSEREAAWREMFIDALRSHSNSQDNRTVELLISVHHDIIHRNDYPDDMLHRRFARRVKYLIGDWCQTYSFNSGLLKTMSDCFPRRKGRTAITVEGRTAITVDELRNQFAEIDPINDRYRDKRVTLLDMVTKIIQSVEPVDSVIGGGGGLSLANFDKYVFELNCLQCAMRLSLPKAVIARQFEYVKQCLYPEGYPIKPCYTLKGEPVTGYLVSRYRDE